MKTAFRVALFLALLSLSALSLLLLLPFLKEGASWQDLPIFAGTAFGAVVLGVIWWLAAGRSMRIAVVGWAVLLPAFAAHGFATASLVAARVRGVQLESVIRVENYREEPIAWPGFDGPVGLEISLDLVHPPGIEALIVPPEVRMGPDLPIPRDSLTSGLSGGSGRFRNPDDERVNRGLALLKPVLFQRLFENPAAINQGYRWSAATRFAESGRTALTYQLLPGSIDFLPSRNRICLGSRSPLIPVCDAGRLPDTGCRSPNDRQVDAPAYNNGSDLSALWLAAGSWDMLADISDQLTTAMRRHSMLQGRPERWTAIHKRLEPSGLADAGYDLCPPGDGSHTRFRTCFCMPD